MKRPVAAAGGTPPARRRSGLSVPEGQRKTVAVKLRLETAESAALDALAADGAPVSRLVGALLIAEVARRRRRGHSV